MEETKRCILIGNDLRPAYYDDFHCLAGDCRLSCCKGHWRITFDRKDYLKIKKQKGSPELNHQLEHIMRRVHEEKGLPEGTYAELVMEKGVCSLLDQDGLCALQREKGADILPRVCKIFPRREVARCSGYLERSLSPACEGVLALLWDHPEGVDFRSDSLPKEERVGGSLMVENSLSETFQDIRSLCIDFLQDRRRPLSHRIFLMGLTLKELAEGETDIHCWLERGRLLLEQGDTGELLLGADGPRAANLAFLNNIRFMLLLRIDREMGPVLECMQRWLSVRIDNSQIHANREAYDAAQKRYEERYADGRTLWRI